MSEPGQGRVLVVGGHGAPNWSPETQPPPPESPIEQPRRRATDLLDRPEPEILHACSTDIALTTIRRSIQDGRPIGVVVADLAAAHAPSPDLCERALSADPSLLVLLLGSDPLCRAAIQHVSPSNRPRLHQLDPGDEHAPIFRLVRTLDQAASHARALRIRNAELSDLLRERDSALDASAEERREVETRLRHAALHDALTGLPNRIMLNEQLARCLELSKVDAEYRFAVLYLDLDNFKSVNDSLGHKAGDELLRIIAERLQSSVRALDAVVRVQSETAARLGGDEFVLLLDGITRSADAGLVAERVGRALAEPVRLERYELATTASIGVAVSTPDDTSPEDVLRKADLALYRAKEAGKGQYAFYDERLHQDTSGRLRMENALRRALEDREFEIRYEPIISIRTGQLRGFEALARWDSPDQGSVAPTRFIPVAEEMGLIVPFGEWALREVCAAIDWWQRHATLPDFFSVSVNISRRQLVEPGFADRVREITSELGIDPKRLCFEVTESAVMADMASAANALASIRDLGISIHMDDFGTGLSALSCLHQMPLDVIKIDRSFILNMRENRAYSAVVQAILTMASHLGFEVIAEGVESGDQLASLISLDCDFVQGYHFSRAVNRDMALEVIRQPERLHKAA